MLLLLIQQFTCISIEVISTHYFEQFVEVAKIELRAIRADVPDPVFFVEAILPYRIRFLTLFVAIVRFIQNRVGDEPFTDVFAKGDASNI